MGPGAKDLVTLRALDCLKRAEIIFYPVKKLGDKSIALETVDEFIEDTVKRVPIFFPMTKEKSLLEKAWREGAQLILDSTFNEAAFVTIGDPAFYCTYFYLHPYLENYLDIEIVPGVFSISACCASLKAPLVLGDESFAVVSGSSQEPLYGTDAVVLMKIPKERAKREALMKNLVKTGYRRMWYLSRCQTDGERIVEGLPEDVEYMSMVIAKR